MVGEAIHLDDALQWHVGLGEQVLDLDDALLLHPAIWRVVELLLEHVVEVLNAKAADVGKLLNSLNTWSVELEEYFDVQICPSCGRPILPCSMCYTCIVWDTGCQLRDKQKQIEREMGFE